jgi:methylated-DNA-[protein]-cysteine S-methyltransferase
MKEIERALKQAATRAHSTQPPMTLAEHAVERGLLDVAYTILDYPVGPVLIAATRRGLVRISFGRSFDPDRTLEELSVRISPRVLEAPFYFDGVRRELDEYFEGRRTRFDLPLDWTLTGGFNRRVLKRTARIPYGQVSTYRELAAEAGSPRAVRAAGNALGSNPIPIVVPCHRVLRTGGALGGYGGGVELKEYLLRLEGAIS